MKIAKTRNGQIIGQRPNWRSGLTESFEYETGIITSEDQTEQRFASRLYPRMRYDFSVDTAFAMQRRVLTDMRDFPTNGLWTFPIYWRYVHLDEACLIDQTFLNHDGDVPWWAVAGTQLVVETDTDYHLFEIDSTASGSFILTGETGVVLSAGTRVYLGMPVRMDDKTKASYRSNRVASISMSLLADPGGNPDWTIFPVDQYWSHEGFEIMRQVPNWRNNVTREFEGFRALVDFGRGVVTERKIYDADKVMVKFTFSGLDRDETEDLIHFFMRQEGRRLPFWVPSHVRDMEVAFEATLGTQTLSVETEELGEVASGDPMFNTLVVTYPNGCMQFNRVTSVSVGSGITVFSLERPWVQAVPVGASVSWANLCRFSSDTLEVSWETDSVAEVAIGVDVLESLYPNFQIGPYPLPVEEESNHLPGSGFSDPVSFPFTEVILADYGVSLEAVDRGYGLSSVYVEGIISATGTLFGIANLTIYFANEAGTQIGTSTLNESFPRDSGQTAPYYLELSAPIPPLTRTVRFRGGMSRSYDAHEGWASVSTREWGDAYSMENLKCP